MTIVDGVCPGGDVAIRSATVDAIQRDSFGFLVTADGNLVDCEANVELLRKLWLDRSLIDGDDLGEGNPGDVDYGDWHCLPFDLQAVF